MAKIDNFERIQREKSSREAKEKQECTFAPTINSNWKLKDSKHMRFFIFSWICFTSGPCFLFNLEAQGQGPREEPIRN